MASKPNQTQAKLYPNKDNFLRSAASSWKSRLHLLNTSFLNEITMEEPEACTADCTVPEQNLSGIIYPWTFLHKLNKFKIVFYLSFLTKQVASTLYKGISSMHRVCLTPEKQVDTRQQYCIFGGGGVHVHKQAWSHSHALHICIQTHGQKALLDNNATNGKKGVSIWKSNDIIFSPFFPLWKPVSP